MDPHRIQEIVDSLFDLEDGSFVVEQAIIIAQPAVVQLLTQAIFYHLQLVVENMQEISDVSRGERFPYHMLTTPSSGNIPTLPTFLIA